MFNPTMQWDEEVKEKFLQMTKKMPTFHRHMAVDTVTKRSEENAQSRLSEMVQEQDVISAFFSDVPSPFYSMMISLLEQSGFHYKQYGYPQTKTQLSERKRS
ncbi:hypothetical protein ACFL38_01110 [Candidatus Omnitrophota bacterium]